MIEIDISIPDPAWETACQDCEKAVEQSVHAALSAAPRAQTMIASGVEPEISVVLANDDLVHTLNREYRDQDKPTNILSFAMLDTDKGWQAPQGPGPCILGDLVLGFETIQREANEGGKSLRNHLTHLIIHGTLHLLGYDHMDDGMAEEMESLEIQILNGLNIENPYKDR